MKTVIGECPVCEILVYDIPGKNREFKFREKILKGYPSPRAMPCGLISTQCPFETPAETAKIKADWLALPAPGDSNYA